MQDEPEPSAPEESPEAPQAVRRPRVLIGAAVALVVVAAAVAFVATRGSDSNTFSGRGFSFEYPDSWHPIVGLSNVLAIGTPVSSDAVGLDVNDVVQVSTFPLNIAFTPAIRSQVRSAVALQVRQLVGGAGGSVLQGPTDGTLGGIKAFRFQVQGRNAQRVAVRATLVYAFRVRVEYFLNCQHTSAHAAEIADGCDQIVRTFRVG